MASRLDKDIKFVRLSRNLWNGVQMGAGIVAFGLLLGWGVRRGERTRFFGESLPFGEVVG